MQSRNYNQEMESILQTLGDKKERMLLHACCAPCSSAVLERLNERFDLTLFYYNPNIAPAEEYAKRLHELERLTRAMPIAPVSFAACAYDGEAFTETTRGLEQEPEGGARCAKCFRLRLEKTAKTAAEQGFDRFATTLTISPLKNAPLINTIGEALAEQYGVRWLPTDFKKKDGYKRSIELSREYDLYRQDYCGCIYSKQERRKKEENDHT